MKKYSNAHEFIKGYRVTDKEIKALNNYLDLKKAALTVKGNEHGLSHIIKALIGRNLFDDEAYYPILNENDKAIKKAVEVLNKAVSNS